MCHSHTVSLSHSLCLTLPLSHTLSHSLSISFYFFIVSQIRILSFSHSLSLNHSFFLHELGYKPILFQFFVFWSVVFCSDCIEEQYWFGRDSKCDYCFEDGLHKNSSRFQTYSKKHFRIFKVSILSSFSPSCCSVWYHWFPPSTLQEDDVVYCEDHSGNGTYVDGQLIGKGKKLPLANNAELALTDSRNKGTLLMPPCKI